jgi:uncharacterized membrane protein
LASKLLLVALLGLLAFKLGFRPKLRELMRRLDFAINVALVLIVVLYSVQIALYYYGR